MGLGALTTLGVGFVFVAMYQGEDDEDGGDSSGHDGLLPVLRALVFGYPIGVYLADMEESSFWMTCVGHSLGLLGAAKQFDSKSERTAWIVYLATPVLASELSRLVPKRFRNPNPLRWLFGKFRPSNARVSFGLVPESPRGLSAIATVRF